MRTSGAVIIPGFMRELTARETPFGRVSVLEDTVQRAHVLVNGTTFHGWQFRDPARLDEPTGYYAINSPLRDLFDRALAPRATVAVVGLGAGVMASLARPGDAMVFFEIDPAVIAIARDDRYFSFLSRSRGRCDVVQGDAFARLADEPSGRFDLIVVDGFFDAEMPASLYTRDALARFTSRLSDRGVVVFHATSTRVGRDHRPALARLGRHLACATKDGRSPRLAHDPDLEVDPAHDLSMPTETRWVAMAARAATLAPLTDACGWSVLRADAPPDDPAEPPPDGGGW